MWLASRGGASLMPFNSALKRSADKGATLGRAEPGVTRPERLVGVIMTLLAISMAPCDTLVAVATARSAKPCMERARALKFLLLRASVSLSESVPSGDCGVNVRILFSLAGKANILNGV